MRVSDLLYFNVYNYFLYYYYNGYNYPLLYDILKDFLHALVPYLKLKALQLPCGRHSSDFKSEFLQIRVEMLHSEVFSAGLRMEGPTASH